MLQCSTQSAAIHHRILDPSSLRQTNNKQSNTKLQGPPPVVKEPPRLAAATSAAAQAGAGTVSLSVSNRFRVLWSIFINESIKYIVKEIFGTDKVKNASEELLVQILKLGTLMIEFMADDLTSHRKIMQ